MRKNFRRRMLMVSIACLFAPVANYSVYSGEQAVPQFPDVLAVSASAQGENLFDFDVTVSSPYDNGRRYADGFRVMDRQGKVYGTRKLWHDHADEQPFTRDLHGVKIPPEIKVVLVEARDQKYGYGGKKVELVLPGR